MSYEQALILHLKLSDDDFGAEDMQSSLMEWELKMMDLIASTVPGGTLDGHCFGGGFCQVYFYGPNIDEVEVLVLPELAKIAVLEGSYYIKQYGKALDENVKKIRVDLQPHSP